MVSQYSNNDRAVQMYSTAGMLLNIFRQSDNKIFLDPLNIFTDGIPRSLELLVNLCASPSRPPLLFSRVLLRLKMATYRIFSSSNSSKSHLFFSSVFWRLPPL